jgi:hypothetical protein
MQAPVPTTQPDQLRDGKTAFGARLPDWRFLDELKRELKA